MQHLSRRTGATLFALLAVSAAHAQSLNPVRSGWFQSGGANSGPSNQNYFVGFSNSNSDTHRNFFVFDLSSITGTITGATLKLYNPINPPDSFDGYAGDATETYELTSTSASIADLLGTYNSGDPTGVSVFGTLGTGSLFSSITASSADNGLTLNLPFNAAGLSALNSSIGGLMGMGGQLTSISGGADQNIFSGTDPTGQNGLNDTPPIVLELVTAGAAAPEPTAVALLALGGLGLIARRRR